MELRWTVQGEKKDGKGCGASLKLIPVKQHILDSYGTERETKAIFPEDHFQVGRLQQPPGWNKKYLSSQ